MRMDSIETYQTVKAWLSRLGDSTQRVARSNFNNWIQWVRENGGEFSEFTPDDLVEYQKNVGNGDRFKILDTLIQPYLKQADIRLHTKRHRYTHIRSFFLHNRAELPKDPSLTLRAKKPPVMGTLELDDIRLVVLGSKPCYQAAFLSMFQGSMDQEMFTYWNEHGYESLVNQLAEVSKQPRDERAIKIELPGRKKAKFEKPYYTFIGPDAIDAIINWLPYRPEDTHAIFTDNRGKPLAKSNLRHYWNYHLNRLGRVPENLTKKSERTGKGLHEMRDVFRSQWSKSPANHIVGEYLMGHQIDPLEYDKSFRDVGYYRGEYLKALPMLQLISSGEPFGQVDKTEIQKLERIIKDQATKIENLESEKQEAESITNTLVTKIEALIKRVENLEKN